jgi:hypothetical protein
MLKLTGYMKEELAATFQLRLPSKEPFAVLYYSEQGWNYQDLSDHQVRNFQTDFLLKYDSSEKVPYVLFERKREAETMHYIRDVYLPGLNY